MSRHRSAIVAILMITVTGCAGPIVYGHAPRVAASPVAFRLAYRPLDVSSSVPLQATAGLTSGAATAFAANEVRAGAIASIGAEGLSALFSAISEGDAMTARGATPDVLVRFTLDDYQERLHLQDGAQFACIMFGSLTVGLGYLPCVGLRNDTEHAARITMRLWDVRGVPVVRTATPGSGELRRTWDTSALAPFATRTYEIQIRSGVSAWGALDTPALERHTRDQGNRIGRELIARAAPDIEEALAELPRRSVAVTVVPSSTPPPVPPTAVAPPADWQGTVRGHIDARRASVLACTAGASVAVRATWQPGSPLTYELVGSADAEVRECVQSALGALAAPPGAPAGTVLHAVAP